MLEFNLEQLREGSDEIHSDNIQQESIQIFESLRKCFIELGGGAGLAAPQIGINKRIFIWTPDRKLETLRLAINPVITYKSEVMTPSVEACYSIPGNLYEIERSTEIQMRFYDLDLVSKCENFYGFEAIVIQHEYDHLNGCLICDRGKLKKHFEMLQDYNNYILKLRKDNA